MWCTRCKKKFCLLCLKPVSFVPGHIHLFVCKGEPTFEDKSFSYMSILLLICIFLLRGHFQSYWCISSLLLMYYCFHMFFDWIESLNSVMGRCMAFLAGITTVLVIIPLLLGFQITIKGTYYRISLNSFLP